MEPSAVPNKQTESKPSPAVSLPPPSSRSVRRFMCHYCPKAFVCSAELVRHERSHTGEKPFQCQFCSRAFSMRGNKVRHERIHSCGFCGQTVARSSSKILHERSHLSTESRVF